MKALAEKMYLNESVKNETLALLWYGNWSPITKLPVSPGPQLSLSRPIATFHQLPPNDAKAPYYLGNLYYDKRQYDLALNYWEASAKLDGTFPTVWRNLALAYFNKRNDETLAVECMERAFQLDTTDARILMELDQLYKKLHVSHSERLKFLESHAQEVEKRDDLCIGILRFQGEDFFQRELFMHVARAVPQDHFTPRDAVYIVS